MVNIYSFSNEARIYDFHFIPLRHMGEYRWALKKAVFFFFFLAFSFFFKSLLNAIKLVDRTIELDCCSCEPMLPKDYILTTMQDFLICGATSASLRAHYLKYYKGFFFC